MLENIDLTKKLDRDTYKQRMGDLSDRLYYVQRKTWEAGIPVIILFEGWDAAGKGTTIHKLTDPIDPRGYKIYPIRASRTYEKKRPWLWRFWLKIPARGEWAIFDRSWYGRVLVERMLHLVPKDEWQHAYRDILDFERTLADDGTLMIKIFLHISKKEQGKRFHKLERDPLNAWRVTDEDWKNHKQYQKWLLLYEEMLERTDSEWAPWTIVEATDKRFTRVKVYQTIIDALEERLGIHIQPGAEPPAEVEPPESSNHLEIIEQTEPTSQESPLEMAQKADSAEEDSLPDEETAAGNTDEDENTAPPDKTVSEETWMDSIPEAVPEESGWQFEESGAPAGESPVAENDDDYDETEDDHVG